MVNKTKRLQEYFPYLFLLIVLILYNIFISQFLATPLWIDELFCLKVIRDPDIHIYSFLKEGDTNPPLFFYVLYFWHKLTGLDLIGLRILPLLCSNLSFVFIYQLFLKRKLHSCAYVYAIFSLPSFYNIYHALDLRPYCLLFLGIASTLYFLYAPYKRYHRFAYIIGLLTCAYSHNFGLIFWFSQFFIYLIFYKKIKTFHFKEFFIINTIVFALYLPWLPNVIYQARYSQAISWIQPISFLSLSQAKNWFLYIPLWPMFFLGVIQFGQILKNKTYNKVLPILVASLHFLSPLVFIFIMEYFGKHLFQTRYLQQTVMAYHILLALLFYTHKNTKIMGGLALLLFYFTLFNFRYKQFYNLTQSWQTDWKTLAFYLNEIEQKKQPIYYAPDHYDFPLKVYLPKLKHQSIDRVDYQKIPSEFYFYTETKLLHQHVNSFLEKLKPRNCELSLYQTQIKNMAIFKGSCED